MSELSLKMREVLSLFLVVIFYSAKLSLSLGADRARGSSNFQILLGDVELGPLSQRPELFKVAAIQNEVINVTDDQQTAVVTVGVNIRLDWSSWVTEVLSADSVLNATYTYYRTLLNESGSTTRISEVLRPTDRIAIGTNEEQNIFYVEITCAVAAPENESDRAIYELEVCLPQLQQCHQSNITVFAIERPPPLTILCFGSGSRGVSSAGCDSNNPIVLRTCTVEALGTSRLSEPVIVPCNNPEADVLITTSDYQPGEYTVTINFTDIYGQTSQMLVPLFLTEPLLAPPFCELAVDGLNINCGTNLDDQMVTLNYICSYDGGPPLPCSRSITIDKASFSPGLHTLMVTIVTESGQSNNSQLAFRGLDQFELNCTAERNATITIIGCEGIGGVINKSEVVCLYHNNSVPMQKKCKLPVTIDYNLYNRNPGNYSITIVANSTMTRDMADYTYSFDAPDIECVQLIEPGRVTVICQMRVTFDRDVQPLCLFDNHDIDILCDDIHNIVIVPSEIPGISAFPLPTNLSFLISAFDPMGGRRRTRLQIHLTKEQPVECSTTVDCSSNGTLMSARECCVNSVGGLSYSIPGQDREQCHTCIVFGWFQDSFFGIEQDSAYNLSAGYLKGAEQAGADARLMLNVRTKFRSARISDISIETTRIQLRPMGDPEFIVFIFNLDDTITEDVNESLILQLVPTPATLQIMPTGEGVFFKEEIPLTIMDTDQSFIMKKMLAESMNNHIIGGVVGTVLAILMAGIILVVIIFLCRCYLVYRTAYKMSMIQKKTDHELWEGVDCFHLYSRADSGEAEITVKSSFQLDLPPHLIIPSSTVKLNETIGQGEFGIVYKGYIMKSDSHSVEEYLAIKTLKGFYDKNMVRDMLKECSRMSTFDHPNVLTLKGVCLDGGPAPYIIMPFMANGSLLAYLKKNRKSLVISHENADDYDAEMVRKQLMDMCIQVAKGMEYLATMKVVHRDLAARNCMIDCNFVIKVADFGLSESIGVKEYFRQDETSPIKLPLKWLPPESINDHIFSEKSDVWAYGVTYWEIFSGGKVPYSEVAVRDIPKLLADGYRLEKPPNDACSEEMYSYMQQCWSVEPEQRPSFSQLVELLSSSLEGMAGYVDIGAFGITTQNVPEELIIAS